MHCHSLETPLWRAGPDGPKTLCNACGVRYKKGKLALYKRPDGTLTAVHSPDVTIFHLPPTKKQTKQSSSPPTRKDSTNGAKKGLRGARVRRANAGTLPPRFQSPNVSIPARSPRATPRQDPSYPFSRKSNGRADAAGRSDNWQEQLNVGAVDDLFSGLACLGIEGEEVEGMAVLPMAADSSSTETFSYLDVDLGRGVGNLDMDREERLEALRGLVRETCSGLRKAYEGAVIALIRLCEMEKRRGRRGGKDEWKEWIKHVVSGGDVGRSRVLMLAEQRIWSEAAEMVGVVMSSSEVVAVEEGGIVELMAEDVVKGMELGANLSDQLNEWKEEFGVDGISVIG